MHHTRRVWCRLVSSSQRCCVPSDDSLPHGSSRATRCPVPSGLTLYTPRALPHSSAPLPVLYPHSPLFSPRNAASQHLAHGAQGAECSEAERRGGTGRHDERRARPKRPRVCARSVERDACGCVCVARDCSGSRDSFSPALHPSSLPPPHLLPPHTLNVLSSHTAHITYTTTTTHNTHTTRTRHRTNRP